LEVNIEIGVELKSAEKEFATKGELVAWAEQQAGVKRRQAYNLLRLGRKAGDLRKALAWAATRGASAPPGWFRIDGVGDLLAAHAEAMGQSGSAPRRSAKKGRGEPAMIMLRRATVVLSVAVKRLEGLLEEAGIELPPLTAEETYAMIVANEQRDKLAVDLAERDTLAEPAAPVEPPPAPATADPAVLKAAVPPIQAAKKRGGPPRQAAAVEPPAAPTTVAQAAPKTAAPPAQAGKKRGRPARSAASPTRPPQPALLLLTHDRARP
jgi:hypothetical protein